MARLIEALCEAPLDGAAEPSAELAALRREAAKLLAEAGDKSSDADAEIAALAASLSGSVSAAPRDTLAELATHSASARLDVESAAAFVETIERSAETAPADLVAEFSEAEAAPRRAAGNFWSGAAGGFRFARVSRLAAACAVIVVASAASWSLYWHEHEQLAVPPAGEVKTESAAPAVAKTKSMETKSPQADVLKPESAKTESTRPAAAAVAPAATVRAPAAALEPAAKLAPAFAARQPCEPKTRAFEAPMIEAPMMMRRNALSEADKAVKKGGVPARPGCDAAPAEDADAAVRKAFEEAERARQNAAPVDGAPASAPAGRAQPKSAPAQDSSVAGTAGRPAAASSQPAVEHATPPREPLR